MSLSFENNLFILALQLCIYLPINHFQISSLFIFPLINFVVINACPSGNVTTSHWATTRNVFCSSKIMTMIIETIKFHANSIDYIVQGTSEIMIPAKGAVLLKAETSRNGKIKFFLSFLLEINEFEIPFARPTTHNK